MMITILETATSVHPKPCTLLPGSENLKLSSRFQTLTDLPESTEVPEDRTLAGGVLANVKADTEEVIHKQMCRSSRKGPKRCISEFPNLLQPRPKILNHGTSTQNPEPRTLNPKSLILILTVGFLNPKPQIFTPDPDHRIPKP